MGAMISRSTGLASLVVATALALSGCSGDSEGSGTSDTPSGSSTAAGGESATDDPSASSAPAPDLPLAPTIKQAVGASSDIDWDPASCTTDAGRRTVKGTVTNPTRKRRGYVITITWISGAQVLGRGIAVVQGVQPGKEADWSLTAKVLDGADQCVPNVLRGLIPDKG
ncbi:hypothetical protein BH11ACT8_BH11ACT8_16870 [soil metagenome]